MDDGDSCAKLFQKSLPLYIWVILIEMQILFLSRWFPYPANNGSKLRVYNLLRGLSQDHRITLLSFYDPINDQIDLSGLHPYCSRIQSIPRKPFLPDSFRARIGYLSPKPRSVVDTFSNEFGEKIENELKTNNYDLVVASQIDMAAYAAYFKGTPAIWDEVEVGVLYEQYYQARSTVDRLRNRLTWMKFTQYLSSLLPHFKLCTVVSEQEYRLLDRVVHGKGRIEIIPNCVDLESYTQIQRESQPNSLIFTGSFGYYPNYEAMLWFLDKVYPDVVARIPGVNMTITGDHANMTLPTCPQVTLTGYIKDIRPLLAQSWCCVVPLQRGGGTRLKILEAMALKTPVISTSKGAEGLGAQNGVHLLVADDPDSFSEAIVQLVLDPLLCQKLATNAYDLVKQTYDCRVVLPKFLELVNCSKD